MFLASFTTSTYLRPSFQPSQEAHNPILVGQSLKHLCEYNWVSAQRKNVGIHPRAKTNPVLLKLPPLFVHQEQTWFMTSLVSTICQHRNSGHRYLIQLKALICNFPCSNARASRSCAVLGQGIYPRSLTFLWCKISGEDQVTSEWPASIQCHIRLGIRPCCWLAHSKEKANSSLRFLRSVVSRGSGL